MVSHKRSFNTMGSLEDYFMGMPLSSFYHPDVKKAIIIGCSEYEELRKIEGKEGFGDIEEAM